MEASSKKKGTFLSAATRQESSFSDSFTTWFPKNLLFSTDRELDLY